MSRLKKIRKESSVNAINAIEHTPHRKLNARPVAIQTVQSSSQTDVIRDVSPRNAPGKQRFVDPTACDEDFSTAETEFMLAMQKYQKSSGRMFPTWSEVLEVLQELGYKKRDREALASQNGTLTNELTPGWASTSSPTTARKARDQRRVTATTACYETIPVTESRG
jgi:hypothetical protein